MTQIPFRINIPDGLEEVAKFADVIKIVNSYSLNESHIVFLHLKNVSFISPYGLIGLLFIGKTIFERTHKKSYIIDLDFKLIRYLERMDFFKKGAAWFHEPAIKKKLSRSKESSNLLEIQEISQNGQQGVKDVTSISEIFLKRGSMILGPFNEKMDVYKFIML